MPRCRTFLLCACAAFGSVPAAADALRCPPPAEIDELVRSAGNGGGNQRAVYDHFSARFGRPAALTQQGNSAEIAYGPGRGTLTVSTDRNPATGALSVRCRDGR